jgi:hypothetical protein
VSAQGLVPVRARNLTRSTELASDVEIAASFWGRLMGLMGRSGLPPGHGLWLPDDNGIHMFFMRFPIDAIFLGKPAAASGVAAGAADAAGAAGVAGDVAAMPAGRPIVAMSSALRPWVGIVPLVRGAHGVLELPAGTIEASGSQVGDRISIA